MPAKPQPKVPGSPAWWSTRRPASAGGRRGRPPRSLEQIVGMALELLDESGPEAFSMRLLAERLGSGTATLYRHVAGKDELLVLVVDRILGELEQALDGAGSDQGGWRETAALGAAALHRILAGHPNTLGLLTSQVPVAPNAMAVRERSIASLLAGGFPPGLAARSYLTIANYVVGFSIQQHGPGTPRGADRAALAELYAGLDDALYPATRAAGSVLAGGVEEEFSFGLALILDGIESALATVSPA